jgi:MFS family permease
MVKIKNEPSDILEKSKLLKKIWPNILSQVSIALSLSIIFINLHTISTRIIWLSEPIHAIELGMLVGTSGWSLALAGIIFGPLADRFSRKNLMGFCMAMSGIFLFINGFIPSNQGNITFYFYWGCVLLQSFFRGGIYPVLNSYTTDSVEEDERSKYYGILNALVQVFQILGMLLTGWLFHNLFWREFYWYYGLFIVLIGLIILIWANEPKRGAIKAELRDVLKSNNAEYKYILTKDTIKNTIFAPTNIIAFAEGIFTTILMAIPDFFLILYLQSPPNNYSSVLMSVFVIIAGLPGAVIGSLAFAKISDKLGKKNIKNRIYLITFSLVFMFTFFIAIFYMPIPKIPIEDSNNLLVGLSIFFSHPNTGFMIALMFFGRAIGVIYNLNQRPVLQKINLPEAQGTVSSANQFLEMIGFGLGPILAGIFLTTFNQNYQISVLILMSIGILGALCWLLAGFWIKKDVFRISKILEERAVEISETNNINDLTE